MNVSMSSLVDYFNYPKICCEPGALFAEYILFPFECLYISNHHCYCTEKQVINQEMNVLWTLLLSLHGFALDHQNNRVPGKPMELLGMQRSGSAQWRRLWSIDGAAQSQAFSYLHSKMIPR